MKVRSGLVWLVLFGEAFASVSAQTWRIGDDQPFPIHITDLPAARQRSILRSLSPSLDGSTKFLDKMSPSEIAAAEKALLLRRLPPKSGSLLLVQGWDNMDLCGATGNCAIWALGPDDRLLLEGDGNMIRILHSLHHGLPSILIFQHDSASESELNRYDFDGTRYRLVSCATQSWGNGLEAYPKPHIERHPCEK